MPSPFDDLLRSAFQLHQSGQLPHAENIYRHILQHEPTHPDALHLLGVIALASKDYDSAIDHIRRALFLKPDFAPAHHNLALALQAKGQLDHAIDAFRQAVALSPASWEFQANLGVALRQSGAVDDAIAALQRAIQLSPNSAAAYTNLGLAFMDKGLLDKSISAHRRAISLDPNSHQAHNNLGIALKNAGQLDAAIDSYQNALALDLNFADAHFNLGQALLDHANPNAAIASFQRAIDLNPAHTAAINNLALAHFRAGHYDQARTGLTKVLSLNPNHANGHWNLGALLLLHGRFEQGWKEYEWRHQSPDAVASPRHFPQPQWTGHQDLKDKIILLHAEQGLGDAIQFIRYADMVAHLGAKVLVECPPPLLRLFQSIPAIHHLFPRGQPLPPFDFHRSLLSLPLAFHTTLQTIPATIPYLTAPQSPPLPHDHLNVGLCWAGNPLHKNDPQRSIPPSFFSPLSSLKSIQFHSLQKPRDNAPPFPFPLLDQTNHWHDLADTASLIAQLDLVITVDTSIAHLAGALGKKVWSLLPYVPDWRWLLTRDDSPWYPTMKLFRQPTSNDWKSVIHNVLKELNRQITPIRIQI